VLRVVYIWLVLVCGVFFCSVFCGCMGRRGFVGVGVGVGLGDGGGCFLWIGL